MNIGGKKIYHAGDTGLTKDMELLKRENMDCALLPIGDFYTMGPEDALEAVKMIKPKYAIPMHYNTSVSYTHLDVYKRQIFKPSLASIAWCRPAL